MLQEILQAKRDAQELSASQIEEFIAAVVSGDATDAHIAAFTMAVCCRGMSSAECAALTRAMVQSGEVCAWGDIDKPIVDKHSTGGVGDKVSLLLAPWLAACGLLVPMISGRGLGHTGGTLDKMDAIPGYCSQVSLVRLRKCLKTCSVAIIGQTQELAPADKRMYAVRDISGSVESVALITASILSKKLAAGLQHLVMDVKVGNGAFCRDLSAARELALSIESTAKKAGLNARAIISDMNQMLGRTAGNGLEVKEVIAIFNDPERAEPRLLGFVVLVASIVSLVRLLCLRYAPLAHRALGAYLPLITSNCAVLGAVLLNLRAERGFIDTLVYAIGAGLGLVLASYLLGKVRWRLESARVPEFWRGKPIALISAGILAVAFMGFS